MSNRIFGAFGVSLIAVATCSAICAQAPPVPPPPPTPTLWNFLGIPQAVNKIHANAFNRKGNHPALEKKPPMLKIADPANLASDVPAIKAAAEIKQAEDLKPQKIKAIKYLAKIGCGCYDKDEKVTKALLAAMEDCTEDVRLEAVRAISMAASSEMCAQCKQKSCCNEKIAEQLYKIAYEMDDLGCFQEPSARVRAAAEEALGICCPGRVPVSEAPVEQPVEGVDQPKPVESAPPTTTSTTTAAPELARRDIPQPATLETARDETPKAAAPEVARRETPKEMVPEVARRETPKTAAPESARRDTPLPAMRETARGETPKAADTETARRETPRAVAIGSSLRETPQPATPESARRLTPNAVAPEPAQRETPTPAVPKEAEPKRGLLSRAARETMVFRSDVSNVKAMDAPTSGRRGVPSALPSAQREQVTAPVAEEIAVPSVSNSNSSGPQSSRRTARLKSASYESPRTPVADAAPASPSDEPVASKSTAAAAGSRNVAMIDVNRNLAHVHFNSDSKVVPVGTRMRVYYPASFGQHLAGELEVVESFAGSATVRGVGSLNVSILSRGGTMKWD